MRHFPASIHPPLVLIHNPTISVLETLLSLLGSTVPCSNIFWALPHTTRAHLGTASSEGFRHHLLKHCLPTRGPPSHVVAATVIAQPIILKSTLLEGKEDWAHLQGVVKPEDWKGKFQSEEVVEDEDKFTTQDIVIKTSMSKSRKPVRTSQKTVRCNFSSTKATPTEFEY